MVEAEAQAKKNWFSRSVSSSGLSSQRLFNPMKGPRTKEGHFHSHSHFLTTYLYISLSPVTIIARPPSIQPGPYISFSSAQHCSIGPHYPLGRINHRPYRIQEYCDGPNTRSPFPHARASRPLCESAPRTPHHPSFPPAAQSPVAHERTAHDQDDLPALLWLVSGVRRPERTSSLVS
jgi:hypothetical protein